MTGPEHYATAELLVSKVADMPHNSAMVEPHLALAQVHATLAQAAATMAITFAVIGAGQLQLTPTVQAWSGVLQPTR